MVSRSSRSTPGRAKIAKQPLILVTVILDISIVFLSSIGFRICSVPGAVIILLLFFGCTLSFWREPPATRHSVIVGAISIFFPCPVGCPKGIQPDDRFSTCAKKIIKGFRNLRSLITLHGIAWCERRLPDLIVYQ
eukprot:sb/3474720/